MKKSHTKRRKSNAKKRERRFKDEKLSGSGNGIRVKEMNGETEVFLKREKKGKWRDMIRDSSEYFRISKESDKFLMKLTSPMKK
jgi:hypothetical protein